MAEITIRKAKLSDVPMLVRMREEFFEEHDDKVLARNPKLDAHMQTNETGKSIAKYSKKRIMSPRSHCFILEVGGKIAGFLLVSIKKNPNPIFKIKEYGFFDMLYVKKEFRGMRASSNLKDEAFAWFRKKGMKYAVLQTYFENREAREVYRKWGFFEYKVEMRTKL